MKSEQVAGFILECMAGFVGIRNLEEVQGLRSLTIERPTVGHFQASAQIE